MRWAAGTVLAAAAAIVGVRLFGRLDDFFLGGVAHMQGLGGGVMVDVAGNYWGGEGPTIDTRDESQFAGADDFETSPIAGVGP